MREISEPLIGEFCRHLHVERGASPHTEVAYSYQLRGYVAFLASQGVGLAASAKGHVLAYLESLEARGLGKGSRYAAAVAIRQFHRFLAAERSWPDPTKGMKLPRLKQRLPQPLNLGEMERLTQRQWGSKFSDLRDRAIIELLYATGLRVSELIGITDESLQLEAGWVCVLGKGAKERLVPFGERAKQALAAYLEARNARFGPDGAEVSFVNARGGPLRRGGVWLRLQSLAAGARIVRLFPHRIRHSTATHMLAGGADLRIIQELLGHANIAVTQRYAHVDLSLLLSTCGATHPAFRKPA